MSRTDSRSSMRRSRINCVFKNGSSVLTRHPRLLRVSQWTGRLRRFGCFGGGETSLGSESADSHEEQRCHDGGFSRS